MDTGDNAAQTLHQLLTAVRAELKRGKSLADAWREALGLPGGEPLAVPMATVAGLIPKIEAQVLATGNQYHLTNFNKDVQHWWQAVAGIDRGWAHVDTNAVAVPQEAIDRLGTFVVQPEHPTSIEDSATNDHLAALAKLIEAVASDKSIDPPLREAILKRMCQLRSALENVRWGGPETVEALAEQLVGAICLTAFPESGKDTSYLADHPLLNQVADLALRVKRSYLVVGQWGTATYGWMLAGEHAPAAIEAAEHVIRGLGN